MFTGIIQAVGRVAALQPRGDDRRLEIDATGLGLGESRLGDSIAVSGACLTAIEIRGERFSADVSIETLDCTTLGALAAGARVNLEKSLTPATALGGHLVSGHVDGVGEVLSLEPDSQSMRMRFRVPAALARYVARKGSICIDGVSLTVNEVEGDTFGVNIVPHTVDHTTFDEYQPGRRVNLEVNLVARYLERLLQARE